MPKKSLANTQLYIVLQQNWDWNNRRMYYWYYKANEKIDNKWPGGSPTVQGIEF